MEELLNRPPEMLYRYRSAQTSYFLDELEQALKRKIYFSIYGKMNDPFEAQPRRGESHRRDFIELAKLARKKGGPYALVTGSLVNVSGSKNAAIKKAFKRKFQNPVAMGDFLMQMAEEIRREVNETYSLICLSEVSSSLLMWAHYANGHNGIVIGYAYDEGPSLKGDPKNPDRVRYSDQRPCISDVDILRFGSQLDGIRDEFVVGRVFDSIWLTKSSEWAYEKEWRIVIPGGGGYTEIDSLKPVEVIIGAGVEREVGERIINISAGKISVKNAVLSKEHFSLDFVEIHH